MNELLTFIGTVAAIGVGMGLALMPVCAVILAAIKIGNKIL